jgi:DNA adenine methylase
VKWMQSNSSAALIIDLYREYNINFVYAARAINSKAEKRGKIKEVIVTNY